MFFFLLLLPQLDYNNTVVRFSTTASSFPNISHRAINKTWFSSRSIEKTEWKKKIEDRDGVEETSQAIFQNKTLKQEQQARDRSATELYITITIYTYIAYTKRKFIFIQYVIQWYAYIYEIYVHRVQFIYSFIYVILLSSSVICISI